MSKKTYIFLVLAVIMPFLLIAQRSEQYLAYRPYKFFPQESDWMLFEDSFVNKSVVFTYCESTKKLYFLDGKNTVTEYDLEAAKRGTSYKRTFVLPFDAQSQMDNSPNGQYLAFVDENHENLHVFDVTSGKVVASVKLGKKFDNYFTTKTGEKKAQPCPFAFQSNREILVSGMTTAMLFDIESKKGKTISLDKSFKDYCVTSITANGKISGTENNHYITYEVSGGEITNVLSDVYWFNYHVAGYNMKRCPSCAKYDSYYNAKTGEEFVDFCHTCDEARHYSLEIHYLDKKSYFVLKNTKGSDKDPFLMFREAKYAFWLNPANLFCLVTDTKMQVFNHELTSNEMEKQLLLSVIDSKDVDRFNDYLERNPNSIYNEIAKQKRTECIADLWNKTSKPSDYTLAHFWDLKIFIDKYGLYGDVQAARDEQSNILKKRYEQLDDNDIQNIEKYIKDFPSSPYINQVKQKHKLAYKPGYDALCLEQSSKPYLDYVKNNPNSPYLEDVKARAKILLQQEEDARIAEQKRKEAEALAEKQRKKEEQKRQEEERIAEQKRKEEEALAEQKRQEEERKKLIAANSDVKNWVLGNKLCKCDQKHIMVVLDSWNENKTAFKGQVLSSDVFYYDDAQLLQRNSLIWFETNGWHKCLEDEIEYCRTHDRSHEISADGHIPPPASFTRLKKGDVVKYYHEWTESVGNWLFGYRDVTKSCLIFADVEDVNDNCSRIKVKITSASNACGDSYYPGKTLWWDANEWEKVR